MIKPTKKVPPLSYWQYIRIYNYDMYIANPLLGLFLANVFVCELENILVPTLAYVDMWTRYVDDTFVFMKANQQTEISRKLNSFHPSIKFTYEKENNKSISFLDVLVKETMKTS